MIKIRPCQNGAYIQLGNETPVLYQFDEDDKKGLVEMLYEIVAEFDSSGKYDRERIRIQLEHGSGYDCKDKQCPICLENL